MSKDVEYTGVVIYAANREAIEGNYGGYHDAVFSVYDENGEYSTEKQDWVRVYADVKDDQGQIDLLLDLSKGDDVELTARKLKGKWKWFLTAFDDLEADDAPGPRPAVARPTERKRANTAPRPAKAAPRADDAPPAAAPRRSARVDPLELPDEDTIANVVNTIDMKARFMQHIYSALANEFMADEDIDQPYRPTCDNLTSMTQSIFIDGVRDHKWMP